MKEKTEKSVKATAPKKPKAPKAPVVPTPGAPVHERGIQQFREGLVVEDVLARKNMKTVTVQVERLVQHRVFKKYVRRFKRYLTHDEKNECRMGDRVEIVMTRPISRMKRWKVNKILERAQ